MACATASQHRTWASRTCCFLRIFVLVYLESAKIFFALKVCDKANDKCLRIYIVTCAAPTFTRVGAQRATELKCRRKQQRKTNGFTFKGNRAAEHPQPGPASLNARAKSCRADNPANHPAKKSTDTRAAGGQWELLASEERARDRQPEERRPVPVPSVGQKFTHRKFSWCRALWTS